MTQMLALYRQGEHWFTDQPPKLPSLNNQTE